MLEHRERRENWRHWGPYLSERAWGTVREDYSATGEAWAYFPHDHARSRVYRWNEDGLMGVSDRDQHLCFALALWNGQDPILKERLFGLSGPEGNHGEDVKESYFYLDSTPTHSYMRMAYAYPQAAFPYDELVRENARRGADEPEFELRDTGVFAEGRYFDVEVEYAKAGPDDLCIRIQATNKGPDAATLHLVPQLWFRNTWSWGYPAGPMGDVPERPRLERVKSDAGRVEVRATHPTLGEYRLYGDDGAEMLFTENETNHERIDGCPNASPYVKDAFHRYLIDHEDGAVDPSRSGTKAGVHWTAEIAAGETFSVRLRLTHGELSDPFADHAKVFDARQQEADAFYNVVQREDLSDALRTVQRQAFAGLLLGKQLYYLDVPQWLAGDPDQPPPPASRREGRNQDWKHLTAFDVLSMPDKWEYPWFASWDLAFHAISLALVDPDFAKRQLVLLTRAWYMHPNGQLPAYEWAFGDANPPVHAWAALRVYQIDAEQSGVPDRAFLEGIFHKLLLNFTWWVNRRDVEGRNVFQGGFLGLDNISLFDRSEPLPTGGRIDQSDGTAWMGFFSLNMITIALELAKQEPVYQDIATKFFEHFLAIANAMNDCGGKGFTLWDDEDGFFYDVLHLPNGTVQPLKVRSLVGLMPLLAVTVLDTDAFENAPAFARRMGWFLRNRPQLAGEMADVHKRGEHDRTLFSIVPPTRLASVLRYMLDEDEFLSPYGVRSLSKFHADHPYVLKVNGGDAFKVEYEPAESSSGLFGGNSNWRGPVWFPLNFLLIEALQQYHDYFGGAQSVEFPTGSGEVVDLGQVATSLAQRLVGLFLPEANGMRPALGDDARFAKGGAWEDRVLFHEYFHGDNGTGLGASHQTGWTAVVANLIQRWPAANGELLESETLPNEATESTETTETTEPAAPTVPTASAEAAEAIATES